MQTLRSLEALEREGLAAADPRLAAAAESMAIALTPERINYMQQLNVTLGVQKSVMPLDKVADMSIARDAARLAAKGTV